MLKKDDRIRPAGPQILSEETLTPLQSPLCCLLLSISTEGRSHRPMFTHRKRVM